MKSIPKTNPQSAIPARPGACRCMKFGNHVARKVAWFSAFIFSLTALGAEAQTIDTVVFGDSTSESAHAFNAQFSQIISGGLGQPARKMFADPADTTVSEGGYLEFTVKCNPVADNFVTLKMWGSDTNQTAGGTILLYQMENGQMNQIGFRDTQVGEYSPLAWATRPEMTIPNRFYYTTIPMPLSLTQGRTSVTLRVIGTGMGAKGSPGVYRAYVHQGSFFVPAAGDPQGTPPAPAAIRPPSGGSMQEALNKARAATIANMTSWLANNNGDLNQLRKGYKVSWTPAYQNSLIPPRVVTSLDNTCRSYFANPGSAGGEWGGAYGWVGEQISDIGVAGFGSALDEVVDLGDPAGPAARRVLWSKMLKASRDAGRFGRRGPTTNQGIICDKEIYNANKGLLLLGSADAFTDDQAKRYLLEAVGLLPWMGPDLATGGSNSYMGTDYYLVTPSGLTKENGYVSAYGEVYDVSTAYYGMTGDERFKTRAVEMFRARSYFRFPMVDEDGYRSFRMVGPLDWRSHQSFPFDQAYGERGTRLAVALATKDPYAIGYAMQLFADNQGAAFGTDLDSALALETLVNEPDSGARLPMTEGQPDYAWCDVDNGIVAIKRGEELTWIEPYWQSRGGIHSTGRAMQITPTSAHVSHIRINTQFDWNGNFRLQSDTTQWTGVPYESFIGTVHGGYANERILQSKAPDTAPGSTREEFIGRAKFYSCRYGRYLVGINMDKTQSYVLKTPAGFVSAQDLISKTVKSGTITVASLSSVVLDLGTEVEAAPLPINPRYIQAKGLPGGNTVYWNTSGGATSYTLQRATTPGGPYTTIATGVGAVYPKKWGQWPYATFTDTTATVGTTYYYKVAGVNTNGEGYYSPESPGAAPVNASSVNTLPAPWSNVNFAATGSTSYNATTGTFTLTGGGGDIWNTNDGGHYVYQPLVGDGTIVARLTSAGAAYKCGLMIRETLATNSRHVTLMYQSGGLGGMKRDNTGAGTGYVSGSAPGVAAPVWLKFARIGKTMFLSYAPDVSGAPGAWTNYAQQNTDIAAIAYIGLYTTSGNPTFDNVTGPTFGNTIPGIAANLTATGSNGNVSLAWAQADQATSYAVSRGTTPGGPYSTVLASGLTGLGYTDNTVTNGTTYYYVVTATNSLGTGAASAQAVATPAATAAAPAGLTVTPSGTQAALSWSAASGATSYTVLRSLDGVSWLTVASGVTGTTYTDTGLSNGQSYLYSVQSNNGSGSSAPAATVATTALPSATVLLDAAGAGTQAILKWNTVSGATGYRVKRSSTSGGPYTTVASAVSSASHTDGGLTNGADYYYVITALNGAGESAASTEMKLGWGSGLLGRYYNTTNFSGTPVLTRVDPAIVFNWGQGSPDPMVNVDNFSVRWVGKFEAATTGSHTFTSGSADDGFSMTINGLTFNKGQSITTNLVAGQKYDVTVDFIENGGAAYFTLDWTDGTEPLKALTASRLYPGAALSNRASGGTGTASGANATTAPAAFDGNNGSKWYNSTLGGVGWLQYQFASGITWPVTEYRLVSGNDVPQRDPKDWQFQGSNDGSTWITLDTQAAQAFASRGLSKIYPVSNTTAYAYYRLNVTANSGGSGYGIQLAEFGLYSPDVLPAAPASVSTLPGNNQVTVGWLAVSGATSYSVKRSSYAGGPYTVMSSAVTGTSYTDASVANGNTYYYVVSSTAPVGSGVNSAPASAYVAPVPGIPDGLSATASNTQVLLEWNGVTWATSYNVLRSTTSGSGYTTIASGLTSAAYMDATVTSGSVYYYVVSASNASGTSGNSAQVVATPGAPAVISTNTPGGSSNEQPPKAFDGNVTTKWYNGVLGGAAILQYQFENGLSKTIASYAITSANDVPQRDPKDWTLQASTNGTTWVTLDTCTAQTFSGRRQTRLFTIASPAPYAYYRLNVTANAGGSGYGLQMAELALIPTLPSPWATGDIGTVGVSGAAGASNGVFTAVGAGADIWGTADSFRYIYQNASGDCSITARVTAVQNTGTWAKGGVMIRETLNANSVQATCDITQNGTNESISRLTTGATSTSVTATGYATPYWVRLERSGNTFTSSRSADGVTWTVIRTQTVTMGSSVYIGLPVCSYANSALALAGFDKVTVVP